MKNKKPNPQGAKNSTDLQELYKVLERLEWKISVVKALIEIEKELLNNQKKQK